MPYAIPAAESDFSPLSPLPATKREDVENTSAVDPWVVGSDPWQRSGFAEKYRNSSSPTVSTNSPFASPVI